MRETVDVKMKCWRTLRVKKQVHIHTKYDSSERHSAEQRDVQKMEFWVAIFCRFLIHSAAGKEQVRERQVGEFENRFYKANKKIRGKSGIRRVRVAAARSLLLWQWAKTVCSITLGRPGSYVAAAVVMEIAEEEYWLVAGEGTRVEVGAVVEGK